MKHSKIEPIDFEKKLNSVFNCHVFSSILITVLVILQYHNGLFSETLFHEKENDLLKNNVKDQSKFTTIFYSVFLSYIFLLLLGLLKYTANRLAYNTRMTSLISATEESNTSLDDCKNKCQSLLEDYAHHLHISGDIFANITSGDDSNASASQFFACSKKNIYITSGFFSSDNLSPDSLELTLAHECIHLKRDLPVFLNKGSLVMMLYAANLACLTAILLPQQMSYLVTGSILFGFKPVLLYLFASAFILNVACPLLMLHRLRLLETRADFESLFSDIKFTEGEHAKSISFFKNEQESERINSTSLWSRFKCSELFSTHPSNQKRIDMLEASRAHYADEKTVQRVTVAIIPKNSANLQSEALPLLFSA